MSPADPLAPFRLDDKVAIVTGASSGLGRRFAEVLHGAGATVVASARRRERLDTLAAELGSRVVPCVCDVTNDADLAELVETALGVGGRIDVLVNNAGVGGTGPALEQSAEHYRSIMSTNVDAPFRLSQLVAPHMIDAGSGSIINISSVLGLVGAAPIKEAAYCVSKGAVVNMTRALGAEWGRLGIRVNSIAPGWFRSEMTEDDMFGSESGAAFIRRNTPMGRPGETHELDGALLFLASDASTYVTGQIIAVDGGWLAH